MSLWKALSAFSFACLFAQGVWAAPVPITLIHTNDLHSHFRPERSVLGLGGIARIKTAIDSMRAKSRNSLVVDGGDWSEGQAYYMLGTGRETLKLMGEVGYDVAVVGNHDWLNGPDRLLDAYESSGTKLQLIGANADVDDYAQGERFRKLIPPYVIREIDGVKIAFIGVLTYEKIYDRYMKPVDITEPFLPVARLAAQLKKSVDAVVAVSHNTIISNKMLLQTARSLDLVIGAHDHQKLVEPVVVKRPAGSTAWIVETGCWGRYVGQVQMKVTPKSEKAESQVELVSYGLTQMDSSIPEDPAIVARIDGLEAQLEAQYRAPIFHDHVADLDGDISRDGNEPLIGDLATDAYREATGAEVSFEELQFVYGQLYSGPLRTVDFLNAAPGIYNPDTGKSWTLHTLSLSGRAISNLLSLFYSSSLAANHLGIAASGVQMIYSPLTEQAVSLPGGYSLPFPTLADAGKRADGLGPIKELKINGQLIDPKRRYVAAIGGGTVAAFQFLNSLGPDVLPLDDLKDTGLEVWRTLASYVGKRSPFSAGSIPQGDRMRSEEPDLSVRRPDIRWKAGALTLDGRLESQVSVTVRNFGAKPSPGGVLLQVAAPSAGINTGVPSWAQTLGTPVLLPEIAPGAAYTVNFNVAVPGTRGIFPLQVYVSNNDAEVVHANDAVELWLSPGRGPRP